MIVKAARFDSEALVLGGEGKHRSLSSGERFLSPRARQELAEARAEAEEILAAAQGLREGAEVTLQNAQIQAGRILASAEAEIRLQREDAYRQGFDEGKAEGRAEGRSEGEAALRAEMAESFARLRALGDSAYAQHAGVLRAAENEAVALTLAIAEKVIGRAISFEPEIIESVVRSALDEALGGGAIRVYINPEDLALLGENSRSEQRKIGRDQAELELIGDESIERGGCVIMTASGRIDARLTTQLAQIAESFLG